MTKRENIRSLVAVLLTLAGLTFITVRPWGMRFSGFLLLGVSAVLVLELLLRRWAQKSKAGRRCHSVFRIILTVIVVSLLSIETAVINVGRSDLSALPADAVVVLGAGVNGTQPSLSLRTRLEAALEYLEYHPEIPAVLTGGQGYGEAVTEARCMYDWLTARGVEPERLILEERAGNTAENFAFSKDLLKGRGIDPGLSRIAVVTNDFHIARSRLIAAREGYGHAFGIPARLPWRHLEVNYYLREAFAMVKTLLFD